MTKADLVDMIHERVGSPKKEAGEVVDAFFAIIRESLRDGSKIETKNAGARQLAVARRQIGGTV